MPSCIETCKLIGFHLAPDNVPSINILGFLEMCMVLSTPINYILLL